MLHPVEVPPHLRGVRGAVLNERPDATSYPEAEKEAMELRKRGGGAVAVKKKSWRDLPIAERLTHALVKGKASTSTERRRCVRRSSSGAARPWKSSRSR